MPSLSVIDVGLREFSLTGFPLAVFLVPNLVAMEGRVCLSDNMSFQGFGDKSFVRLARFSGGAFE